MGTNSDRGLLGAVVPSARRSDGADVFQAVEQATGGDTWITVGRAYFGVVTGELRQVRETAIVRLTSAEREELIRQLMTHRFADLTADLAGEGGER